VKNIELLPVTPEIRNRISEMAKQYKRFAKVYIDVVSFDKNKLVVRVEQKEPVNGKVLNSSQLVDRVRELFKGELPDGITLNVSPVYFDREEINQVSPEWIKERIAKHNLKLRNLHSYTNLDVSTLSSIINGEKPLTKWHKVAIYYFFKYYEFTMKQEKAHIVAA
jgi:hypothetical protein